MSEQGCCRDCRWWGEKDNDLLWAGDIRHPTDRHHCMLTYWDGQRPDWSHTKAYAVDGDNFLAILLTAPDFGCVQFEAKPE